MKWVFLKVVLYSSLGTFYVGYVLSDSSFAGPSSWLLRVWIGFCVVVFLDCGNDLVKLIMEQQDTCSFSVEESQYLGFSLFFCTQVVDCSLWDSVSCVKMSISSMQHTVMVSCYLFRFSLILFTRLELFGFSEAIERSSIFWRNLW